MAQDISNVRWNKSHLLASFKVNFL
jgi:hypothetical protein